MAPSRVEAKLVTTGKRVRDNQEVLATPSEALNELSTVCSRTDLTTRYNEGDVMSDELVEEADRMRNALKATKESIASSLEKAGSLITSIEDETESYKLALPELQDEMIALHSQHEIGLKKQLQLVHSTTKERLEAMAKSGFRHKDS